MSGVITFENITFLIAIVATIFSVYHFFRKPDLEADKRITETEKETDKRLCLLEQLLKSERSKNELLTDTQKNHLHSIENKVDKNNENIKTLTSEIVKISTILEERLPKNNNL